MKIIKLLSLLFFLSLFSCSYSPVNYLGETYQTTNSLEVFYDDGDISNNFKAIGTMTSEPVIDNDFSNIKNQMIATAKEKGAHAIVFNEIDYINDCDKIIKATLVRYILYP